MVVTNGSDDGAHETVAAVEAKARKAMMLIVQQTDTSGIIGTFMLVRRRRGRVIRCL